ncbi:hypothetical protein NQZ68_024378, partial [Dissostichus eleginoides]
MNSPIPSRAGPCTPARDETATCDNAAASLPSQGPDCPRGRKRRGDLRYRGTPVQIYEDFTQEVLEQWAKYRDIMSKLYNLGLRPALLFPARLQITLGSGAKKRFPSPGG